MQIAADRSLLDGVCRVFSLHKRASQQCDLSSLRAVEKLFANKFVIETYFATFQAKAGKKKDWLQTSFKDKA